MPVIGKSLDVSLGNFSVAVCTSPDNFKPNQLLHGIRGLAASYRRDSRFGGRTVERPAVRQSDIWLARWFFHLLGKTACQSSSEKAIGLGQLLWSEGGMSRTRGGLSTNKKSVSAKPKEFYSQVLVSRETRGSGASYWVNLVSKTSYICKYIESLNQQHPP